MLVGTSEGELALAAVLVQVKVDVRSLLTPLNKR
jgi:hypothetical protein